MLNPGMKTEKKWQKQGKEKERRSVWGKDINCCFQEDECNFVESLSGLYILHTLCVYNVSLNQSSEV